MRLPTPMNQSRTRGRFSRARKHLSEQRNLYLAKCYDCCQSLKGQALFDAVIEIADRMSHAGLYSMAKNQVRFSVLRWFALQEQDPEMFDIHYWQRWLTRRRINLSELKVA